MRLSVQAGDLEINLEGAAIQIDEQIAGLKFEDTWSVMIDRIREAREFALDAAVTAAKDAGLPERGSAFRTLLEMCSLTKKPDQVLGAIHYLRSVEHYSDCPPRTINELFEDAGIEPPGNLSLYLNRLKERGFLDIPDEHDDKNRFAILTPEGLAHLDERSNA